MSFIQEHQIHCIFISESWERPEFDLSKLINIENFTVISNPHQRKGSGGRPALVINTKHFHARNLTNTLVQIPWGCEATWAVLTPKTATNTSKIKRIVVCSLYCKPGSRSKTKLLDHIGQTFHLLSAKFGAGLHFILAGDTNELKLNSILQLHPRMQQMVKGFTRLNPPRMLDPILITLGCYYQTQEILPPLNADPDSNGSPSDHFIPVMKPINVIENRCSRTYREITILPVPKSGLDHLRRWIEVQDWTENLLEGSADEKAELLLSQMRTALNRFLPEKVIRIASDDQPWFTDRLKKLDRRRRKEYRKNRRSTRYIGFCRLYQAEVSKAKIKYKRNMIDDVKSAYSGEWYSKLKRISRYDEGKDELIQVEEISHLGDQEQAELIADKLSAISNTYKGVELTDIIIPPFAPDDIPQITTKKVKEYMARIKVKKATPPGDIPAKIIKEFSDYLCIPIKDIINSSLRTGKWPSCYKKEIITPIPKEHPVLEIDMLRPISALLTFNKLQESIICEMVISDMSKNLDPTQYGNRKRTGIQHYLVKMLHRILSKTDKNSRRQIKAVICNFVDWKQAYSRQSHILGIRSFMANGVRPSLIPVLTDYFRSRSMKVKWHGVMSKSRNMPGSGAMGSILGN